MATMRTTLPNHSSRKRSSTERESDTDVSLSGPLLPYEETLVDAVGTVISFWQFKRNHGRIWATLFLRDAALSQSALQQVLGLSKGAASMLLGELESHGVVRRLRLADGTSQYRAQLDIMELVRSVLITREQVIIRDIVRALEDAEVQALASGAPAAVRERIASTARAARLFERALSTFVRTATFDMTRVLSWLAPGLRSKSR